MKQEDIIGDEIRDFYHEESGVIKGITVSNKPDVGFDPVNRPSHYNQGKFNVLEVQEDWAGDEPLVHAAIKYIARRKYKGKELEDLKKSVWYLTRHIEKLEGKK